MLLTINYAIYFDKYKQNTCESETTANVKYRIIHLTVSFCRSLMEGFIHDRGHFLSLLVLRKS